MTFRLSNVEIIWPKLDVPYWYNKAAPNPFDPTKTGYSERVEKTDKRGAYECAFLVSQEQAEQLAAAMHNAFSEDPETKGKVWARSIKDKATGLKSEVPVTQLSHIFEQREAFGDRWIVKTKNNCFGDPTTKPAQYDKNGVLYPDDFQLTKHSKGHANIKIDPWASASSGVSLRLDALLVTELAERQEFDPGKPKEHPFKDLVGEAPKTGFEDITNKNPGGYAQASLMPDAPVQKAPEKANPFGGQSSAANPFASKETQQVDIHPSLDGGVEDEIPF